MVDLRTMITDWRCRQLAAALVDYSEGVLAPLDHERVERHVADCPRCAAALAALRDVPAALRAGPEQRDDAFWAAQRRQIMERVDAPAASEPERLRGFDWRLALPLAAAIAIALAGYLSLRAPASPGAAVLDALPSEDFATLVDVAGDIVPPPEVAPDTEEVGAGPAVAGALEAGWIGEEDAPGWSALSEDELDELDGLSG